MAMSRSLRWAGSETDPSIRITTVLVAVKLRLSNSPSLVTDSNLEMIWC